MKTLQDCIRFSNANPVCFLATVEGDQPRVRALLFWFADETGFYFQTGEVKNIPNQLRTNPKAEVCFAHPEQGTLRVCGSVEFLNERLWQERALEERSFLKQMGLTADRLTVFRIAHGEAHFWTPQNNLKPKEIIRF